MKVLRDGHIPRRQRELARRAAKRASRGLGADPSYVWTTGNPLIATVSGAAASATVTGVKAGKTLLSCNDSTTGAFGSAVVHVTSAGGTPPVVADTIFIQNDTDTTVGSPWYVTQVDKTHYTMADATEPKNAQYIGAFIWHGDTDTRGDRVGPDAKWTTSDDTIVHIGSTTDSGQAIINLVGEGTATLTCTLNDMVSTLVITAKAEAA